VLFYLVALLIIQYLGGEREREREREKVVWGGYSEKHHINPYPANVENRVSS